MAKYQHNAHSHRSLWPFGVLSHYHLIAFLALFSLAVVAPPPPPPANLLPADQQVHETISYLSAIEDSEIAPPDVPLASIEKFMRKDSQKPLKLLWIEHVGTFGDVATSMTVLKKLLTKRDYFDIHIVVDPRAVKYMPNDMVERTRYEIAKCNADGFLKCVQSAYKRVQPDIIVRGHPVRRQYKPEEFWDLFSWAYWCLKKDDCVLVDIKSYVFTPLAEFNYRYPPEYTIAKNQFTLVGQQPEIYNNPDPIETRQVLVGKYKTSTNGETGSLPRPLRDFIRNSVADGKGIMYLGIGGFLRKWNEDINDPLKPLKLFAERTVKSTKKWDLVVFHNTPKSTTKPPPNPPITHDGRVYHVWFGELSLLDLWRQEGVDIVLHHCGAGSFSDAIAAGKPMICIPYDPERTGAGKDGLEFTRKVNEMKLGVGLPPIDIANSWRFDVENGKKLDEAFRHVTKYSNYYNDHIKTLQAATERFSGAKNAYEMIMRAGHGLYNRRLARKEDSCPA